MAVNHRSGRPEGAKGDSPGQSEAPPWDWCARNNPSPERAEPAARKPMCYISPFQGLGELGRRRAQVACVPRVALRSTLGYLIMPRWGERSRGKNSGTVPGFVQFPVVRRVRAAVPWSLDSSFAQTTNPQFEVKKRATHGPRNVPPSASAVRLWLSRDQPSIRPPQRGKR
jgi:hypothetical protein